MKYKALFYEQFLRVLTSKNKMYKFGLSDSDMCIKCNVRSDSEHAIFYCFFPEKFIQSLALFLDQYFNKEVPEFIFLKEHFYLFNIYFEDFSNDEYLQLTYLILVAKERSLQISKDECLSRWNEHNCISQSILITQFVSRLLTNLSLNDQLVLSFLDFLIGKCSINDS